MRKVQNENTEQRQEFVKQWIHDNNAITKKLQLMKEVVRPRRKRMMLHNHETKSLQLFEL